jgi:hypothetical protein
MTAAVTTYKDRHGCPPWHGHCSGKAATEKHMAIIPSTCPPVPMRNRGRNERGACDQRQHFPAANFYTVAMRRCSKRHSSHRRHNLFLWSTSPFSPPELSKSGNVWRGGRRAEPPMTQARHYDYSRYHTHRPVTARRRRRTSWTVDGTTYTAPFPRRSAADKPGCPLTSRLE